MQKARSFHIDGTSIADIVPLVRANIKRESELHTDEAQHYKSVGKEVARHGSVAHKYDEYVRGDVHTNTVEGFYSIFKRGMKGVYQHCGEKHLHRYFVSPDNILTRPHARLAEPNPAGIGWSVEIYYEDDHGLAWRRQEARRLAGSKPRPPRGA